MNAARETTRSPEALQRLDSRLGELRHEAEALLSTLDQTTSELEVALREQLDRRPYRTLAVAAAVGYLLGGGLPSRLTRVIVGVGGRFGVEYLYRQFGTRFLAAIAGENAPSPTTVAREPW